MKKHYHIIACFLFLVLAGCQSSKKAEIAKISQQSSAVTTTVTTTVDTKKQLEKELANKYQEVTVVNVIDGDTLTVRDAQKNEYKVRLIGVDTPEVVHPTKSVEFYGKEASEYTKEKLLNKTVYLEKDVSDKDSNNRFLRYVWYARPNTIDASKEDIQNKLFNAIIVKEGYAKSSTYQPDVKYQDIFTQYQQEAQSKSIGLWNAEAAKKYDEQSQLGIASKVEETKQTTYDKRLYNEDGTVVGILSTAEVKSGKTTYIADTTPYVIKGNSASKIYHCPGQRDYNRISVNNVIHFATEADAQKAGYRKATR